MAIITTASKHNVRQLYWDIFWFGVLAGSAQAFLAVYAARIGATGFQIGLLTAGPAVVNLLFSLPAARWLEGRSLVRAALETSLWNRAGYLLLLILPALFAPGLQSWLLPGLIILMSIPATILAISFNAMLADVVAPDLRGEVVGRRNALLAVSMTGTSLFSGRLLTALAFPLNYQVVFGLGVLGAALSSFYLSRLRPEAPPAERAGQTPLDFTRRGFLLIGGAGRSGAGLRFLARAGAASLLRLDLLRGPFGPFLLVFLLFYTFQFTPIPIVTLYFVRDLHLSDSVISIGNALFYGSTLAGSIGFSRLTRRFGHHRVLTVSALLYGLYPVLVGLAGLPGVYYLASIEGGAVWGVASGALVTRLMERVPVADRPAHMALHNLALNVGILAGSLFGPALGEVMPLRAVLFLSGGLRLLGGLLIALRG